MTSGNRGDEPIARDDEEALRGARRHRRCVPDRTIARFTRAPTTRCCASWLARPSRCAPRAESCPMPSTLPFAGPPLVAVGAHTKSTVCFVRGDQAFVSQHLGDLSQRATASFFEETIAKLGRLLRLEPADRSRTISIPTIARRVGRSNAVCRVWPFSIITRTSPPAWPSTAARGRPSGWLSTEPAAAATARPGAASGWWPTFATSAASATCVRSAYPAARRQFASLGVWRCRRCAMPVSSPFCARRSIDERRRSAVLRLCSAPWSTPTATSAGRWFDAIAALAGVRYEVTTKVRPPSSSRPLAGMADVSRLSIGWIAPASPFVVDSEADRARRGRRSRRRTPAQTWFRHVFTRRWRAPSSSAVVSPAPAAGSRPWRSPAVALPIAC